MFLRFCLRSISKVMVMCFCRECVVPVGDINYNTETKIKTRATKRKREQ